MRRVAVLLGFIAAAMAAAAPAIPATVTTTVPAAMVSTMATTVPATIAAVPAVALTTLGESGGRSEVERSQRDGEGLQPQSDAEGQGGCDQRSARRYFHEEPPRFTVAVIFSG